MKLLLSILSARLTLNTLRPLNSNPNFKGSCYQAKAYRKLAAKRAADCGLPWRTFGSAAGCVTPGFQSIGCYNVATKRQEYLERTRVSHVLSRVLQKEKLMLKSATRALRSKFPSAAFET